MCDNCPSRTTEHGAEWTRETAKPTGERPLPVPGGRGKASEEQPDLLVALEHEIDVMFEKVDIERKTFDGRIGNPKTVIKGNIMRLVEHRLNRDFVPNAAIDVAVKEAEATGALIAASSILIEMAPLMAHRLEEGFPEMTAEVIGEVSATACSYVNAWGDKYGKEARNQPQEKK